MTSRAKPQPLIAPRCSAGCGCVTGPADQTLRAGMCVYCHRTRMAVPEVRRGIMAGAVCLRCLEAECRCGKGAE